MKKYFTLLIITLVSVCAAVAQKTQSLPKIDESTPTMLMPALRPDQKAAASDIFVVTASEAVRSSRDEKSAAPVEGNADETEGDETEEEEVTWNISYTYPDGSFFPTLQSTRKIIRTEDQALLDYGTVSRGTWGLMVPPFVDHTWDNFIQHTEITADGKFSKTWLPETEETSWKYWTGDYAGYLYKTYNETSYNLTANSQPPIVALPLYPPTLTYGESSYVMNDGEYTDYMFIGSIPHLYLEGRNYSYESTLVSDGTPVTVEYSDTKMGSSYLFDTQASDGYLRVCSYAAAGNVAGTMWTSSANDVVTSSWSRALGVEQSSVSVDGLFQIVKPSPISYTAKSISIRSYYGAITTSSETSIECVVYTASYNSDGDIVIGDQLDSKFMTYNGTLTAITDTDDDGNKVPVTDASGNPIYGGWVTLSASLEDIFAEEGEEAYLNVPANTMLLVEFKVPEDCPIFCPGFVKWSYDNGPDGNNYSFNAGVMLKSEGTVTPYPVSFNFYSTAADGVKTYSRYTSTWMQMDVEYPYLAAFAKYSQVTNTESYSIPYYYLSFFSDFFGEATNEINVTPELLKESIIQTVEETDETTGETTTKNYLTDGVDSFTGAVYAVVTDAAAEAITFTYSSDALKDALTCTTEMGAPLGSNSYNPAYVKLAIRINQSVTADGWVKASYKGKEVLFNIPATEISGIGDVCADEAAAVEYYDLQGRRVAADNASGVLIQKTTMPDGSVRTAKVIK